MIQPTDLRIGNYVFDWVKRIAIVDSIHKDGSIRLSSEGNYKHESFKSDRLSPIPLTEEILLKCGARRIDKYTFVLLGLFIHMRKMGFVFNVGKKKIAIEHLHQLQNWAHALTNTELNIAL